MSKDGFTGGGGGTVFLDNSSASNGSFINNGDMAGGAGGGFTQFLGQSTAGHGKFTANGGAPPFTFGGAAGGSIVFGERSTAGNGTFTTNGNVIVGALGGEINFFDTSNAGNGTFVTNGAAVANIEAGAESGGGHILFSDTSTADHGAFSTNGGGVADAAGGEIAFFGSSTADHGIFTNNGGAVGGAHGGIMIFYTNSTAGNATFTNNGGSAGGARGGTITFADTATAENGTFINNGAAIRQIVDATTPTNGGIIEFVSSSSAGNGTFTNNGGAVSGAGGAIIFFQTNSKADNGTFINNGGAVSGARGSAMFFNDSSSAANATLIAKAGTGGGDGGVIVFGNDSIGGTSRLEVFGNARLDISFHNDPGLSIGSLEGTGLAFLGSSHLIIGSNNMSTVFSGVINDGGGNGGAGGSLTKIGAGTLILSGKNTYTGDTHIAGGVLQIDGSITSKTFIDSDGTLSGSGEVFANAVNSGIISPGQLVGTLRVARNYDQTTGGTLRIDIAGIDASQHDLVSVGGTALLDGALQLVRLNNFRPRPGDMLTLLTAADGVNGRLSSVSSDFTGTIIGAELVYNPNDVLLRFVQGSFAGLSGLTSNQQSVARDLDQAVPDPRAARLIDFLDMELVQNLPHDFDLIAPEELASIYEIGFSQASIQSINLERRMDDIRAGSSGFSSAGFAPRVGGKNSEIDDKSIAQRELIPAFAASPDNRWGVFVTGTGEFVSVGNDDPNARGYDIATGGFTLGVDYWVTPNFAVGLNAGYARSEADVTSDGHVTVDGGKAGFFATYFSEGFYFVGAAGGGWNSYDTRRVALLGDARGETSGGEFNALFGGGYDYSWRGWTFGPQASLQYTKVAINDFTEEGSLAPLHLENQDEDSFRSTVGLKISRECRLGPVVIRPELRASWQHEFGDRSYPIDARLASGAGNVFTVHGPAVGRDSALIGTGLGMQWNGRISTYLYYDGQLGRNNYDGHNVSSGVRISF